MRFSPVDREKTRSRRDLSEIDRFLLGFEEDAKGKQQAVEEEALSVDLAELKKTVTQWSWYNYLIDPSSTRKIFNQSLSNTHAS
jgi:hypothetical protein